MKSRHIKFHIKCNHDLVITNNAYLFPSFYPHNMLYICNANIFNNTYVPLSLIPFFFYLVKFSIAITYFIPTSNTTSIPLSLTLCTKLPPSLPSSKPSSHHQHFSLPSLLTPPRPPPTPALSFLPFFYITSSVFVSLPFYLSYPFTLTFLPHSLLLHLL